MTLTDSKGLLDVGYKMKFVVLHIADFGRTLALCTDLLMAGFCYDLNRLFDSYGIDRLAWIQLECSICNQAWVILFNYFEILGQLNASGAGCDRDESFDSILSATVPMTYTKSVSWSSSALTLLIFSANRSTILSDSNSCSVRMESDGRLDKNISFLESKRCCINLFENNGQKRTEIPKFLAILRTSRVLLSLWIRPVRRLL